MRLTIVFALLLSLPVGVQAESVDYPRSAGDILETLGVAPPCKPTVVGLKVECKGLAGDLVDDPKEVAQVLDASPDLPKVAAKIHFDTNSAQIRGESYRLLNQYVEAFKNPALRDAVLAISGHTDYRGSEDHNYQLALDRAHAVRDYLQGNDVQVRMVVTSFGENRPVGGDADYQASDEMALNRRVEFVRMK